MNSLTWVPDHEIDGSKGILSYYMMGKDRKCKSWSAKSLILCILPINPSNCTLHNLQAMITFRNFLSVCMCVCGYVCVRECVREYMCECARVSVCVSA